MLMLRFPIALAAAACAAAPPAFADAAPTTVIHAGQVLAEPGRAPLGPHTIVVRGNRIAALQPGLQPAERFGGSARLVDLSDRFVLPGLIDLHMHLAIIANASEATSSSESRLVLAAAAYAAKLLQAGVTTVRDVGDNSSVTLALRDAMASGDLAGPRLYVAGRIVSRSGGHGAKRPRPVEIPYRPAACDGVESCRRAVRENVEQGVDWIKLTVSGSGREASGRAAAEPILFEDEVDAAIAAALQARRPVAAHAHATAAINLALARGAATIEHGTYFDAESVTLFRRKGAYIVPTAFVASHVLQHVERYAGGIDGGDREDLRRWATDAMATPGRAWRAGIALALGTDGGPSFPPDATAREIALYEASGVPAGEAIRAATAGNATALGLDDALGRIGPGYLADLIAVGGSPLEDTGRLRAVSFVMKDGRIHRLCGSAPGPACTPAAAAAPAR